MDRKLTRREWLFAGAAGPCLPPAEEVKAVLVKVKRKPPDEWKEYPTRTIDLLPGFRPRRIRTGKFGGRADRRLPAKGFFYPLRREGRWWLVDPEGHPYINVGVCSTGPGRSPNCQAALKEKFGTEERWAAETVKLLRSYGFSGTGGWSAVDLLRSAPDRMVYTPSWNFLGSFGRKLKLVHQQPGHLGYEGDALPVFHPEFEPFCDEYAGQLAPNKSDPWLLGHYSDNELPAPLDALDKALKLDGSSPVLAPSVEEAKRWLAARKGAGAGAEAVTETDRFAWHEHVYTRYLEVTTRAIRRHDPNHLCLGPRLHGSGLRSPGVLRAAGKHLDVVAVNVYWQWSPDPKMLELWEKEMGKPFVVTEFYAKGMDSGFPNNTGAGWIVPTQKDRGLFYQNFTLALLESRQSVGWHWFKYLDNDPEDLTTDPSNRDSNKGIVSIRYEPYLALLEQMRPVNENVYALIDYFDRRRTERA